jgi:DNA-directed RNA polymerase specialized sigma subunit
MKASVLSYSLKNFDSGRNSFFFFAVVCFKNQIKRFLRRDNQLTGSIPESFEGLKALKVITTFSLNTLFQFDLI